LTIFKLKVWLQKPLLRARVEIPLSLRRDRCIAQGTFCLYKVALSGLLTPGRCEHVLFSTPLASTASSQDYNTSNMNHVSGTVMQACEYASVPMAVRLWHFFSEAENDSASGTPALVESVCI
jgi:hypothetical protein